MSTLGHYLPKTFNIPMLPIEIKKYQQSLEMFENTKLKIVDIMHERKAICRDLVLTCDLLQSAIYSDYRPISDIGFIDHLLNHMTNTSTFLSLATLDLFIIY